MSASKDFSQSVLILIVSTVVVASFSLLTWVVPNFFTKAELIEISTAKPLTPLELEGRDLYINQGCHSCHTMMVRPLEAEMLRYGEASEEADDIYEYPNLWGSKRTGPDLTNLGMKYSNQWHEVHLINPRDVVPTSIMPAYPWLFEQILDGEGTEAKMRALKTLGVPYTEDEILEGRIEVLGRTKGEALIAYLQSLGTDTAEVKEH